MKYVKMLGLAAVAAMALMAFLGASSASATVLCKTHITSGCAAAGWDYAGPLEASLKPGTSAFLEIHPAASKIHAPDPPSQVNRPQAAAPRRQSPARLQKKT